MSICAGSIDRLRAVDHDVRTLTGGITFVVSVLAGHPRFPVVECSDAVRFDPTAEALPARGLDPEVTDRTDTRHNRAAIAGRTIPALAR